MQANSFAAVSTAKTVELCDRTIAGIANHRMELFHEWCGYIASQWEARWKEYHAKKWWQFWLFRPRFVEMDAKQGALLVAEEIRRIEKLDNRGRYIKWFGHLDFRIRLDAFALSPSQSLEIPYRTYDYEYDWLVRELRSLKQLALTSDKDMVYIPPQLVDYMHLFGGYVPEARPQ